MTRTHTHRITQNGRVEVGTNFVSETLCQINARAYPFDVQRCNIGFMYYDDQARKITNLVAGKSNFAVENSEWRLQGELQTRRENGGAIITLTLKRYWMSDVCIV